MIEQLKEIDREIFLWINGSHAPYGDTLMHYVSLKWTWVPLYAFLLYLVWRKYGKRTWLVMGTVALMIGVSDQSANLVKDSVKRYRPCHNTELQAQIHLVDDCGGQYGFVSSHAANTFALVVFLTLLMDWRARTNILFFTWAVVIGFSRIYLGQHYPSDILAGAVLGLVVALLFRVVYLILERKYYPA